MGQEAAWNDKAVNMWKGGHEENLKIIWLPTVAMKLSLNKW